MSTESVAPEDLRFALEAVLRLSAIAHGAMRQVGLGEAYRAVVESHPHCVIEVIRQHIVRIGAGEVTDANAEAGFDSFIQDIWRVVMAHAPRQTGE